MTEDLDEPVATRRLDAGRPETAADAAVALEAEVSGRNRRDLPRLGTVVDPDALDRLFARPSPLTDRGGVAFTYVGYRVVVDSDAVRLYPEDGGD